MNQRRSLAAWPAATLVVLVSLAVQVLVGTLGGAEGGLRLDRPYHQDSWYYAALARSLWSGFPPGNPTFAGEPLTQYGFHLAPLAVASLVVSPYVAMRALNLVYCVLFILLLRRYSPRRFGLVAVCLLLTAPPVYVHNPLSMDLMTRGFHHFPFYILLLVALFEKRRSRLRLSAAALLPWTHGMLAVSFGLPLLFVGFREDRRLIAAYLLGLGSAALPVLLVSNGAGATNLLAHLTFEPRETLWHLVPLGIALIWARSGMVRAMTASGVVLSVSIDWLRYYLLAPLDAGVALASAEAAKGTARQRAVIGAAVACAVAFFAIGMVRQFGPFRPFDRRPVAEALAWIDRSTPRDAVFLVAPTPNEFEKDDSFYRTRGGGYWLAEIRNLYVGFYGWAELAGLPGVERSVEAHRFFSNQGPLPAGVDFVFYGPQERGMYPGFTPRGLGVVYSDDQVAVLAARPLRARGGGLGSP